MSREIIEAYILTQEELLVLLQIAECKTWYGFAVEEHPISEEDAIHIIYHMVEKEFLYSDGEVLHVNKYLSEAVRILKAAASVCVLEDRDNELPVYCCYLGEKILLCEWMSQRKDNIKLKVCDKDDLYQILEDEGYFQQERNFSCEVFKNPSGISEYKIYNQEAVICVETKDTIQRIDFNNQWIKNFFTGLLNKDVKKLDWSNL